MIIAVFGTTGELIKLAPVLRRLQERGRPALLVTTAQQATQISRSLDDFGLADPDIWLAHGRAGRDLERTTDIPVWLAAVARSFARHRPALRRTIASRAGGSLVLVHGDTMTTVLGALMGRALGVPVAHVEAGLRSGDLRNPFPEELNRRLTSRLARVHFAPGPWASANLRAARTHGDIVDTGCNTVADALDLVPHGTSSLVADAPFGIVSLHRFELLGDPPRLRAILELLQRSSRRVPLLFVDHPVTVAAVQAAGVDHIFDDRFRRIPRQRYFEFIALLKRSEFIVTDSGGSQEECAYLGKPCLVHRATTERQEGLGSTVVLSHLDLQVVEEFLEAPERHAVSHAPVESHPSEVVVAWLEEAGYLLD